VWGFGEGSPKEGIPEEICAGGFCEEVGEGHARNRRRAVRNMIIVGSVVGFVSGLVYWLKWTLVIYGVGLGLCGASLTIGFSLQMNSQKRDVGGFILQKRTDHGKMR
jgi:hypothetical protein